MDAALRPVAVSHHPALSRRGLLRAAGTGLAGITLAACAQDTPASRGPSDPRATSGTDPESGSSTAGTRAGVTAGDPTGGPGTPPATALQIRSRATVPVLCYHQVRPWASDDTGYTRSMLIIPPANFAAQLDGIKAAGYTAISPAQYAKHLQTGQGLPAKPVILSFDDGKDNQISNALPALAQRGMTGTFFIMTVILGSPGWMHRDDVKRLVDAGMTIGSHTWDHHMVTKYSGSDYATQLEKPRELLRKLSGQEVADFAYPYGAWNAAILPHLTRVGYRDAYQLQDKPIDPSHPELTLRRILTVSTWTGPQIAAKLDAFS